jgi:hypothetical protein
MIPWTYFPTSATGGSIDPASGGNHGRYPSENLEFFCAFGLRDTQNRCLSSDTAHSWEVIFEYHQSHIDVAARIIKLNISRKDETSTFKPMGT